MHHPISVFNFVLARTIRFVNTARKPIFSQSLAYIFTNNFQIYTILLTVKHPIFRFQHFITFNISQKVFKMYPTVAWNRATLSLIRKIICYLVRSVLDYCILSTMTVLLVIQESLKGLRKSFCAFTVVYLKFLSRPMIMTRLLILCLTNLLRLSVGVVWVLGSLTVR